MSTIRQPEFGLRTFAVTADAVDATAAVCGLGTTHLQLSSRRRLLYGNMSPSDEHALVRSCTSCALGYQPIEACTLRMRGVVRLRMIVLSMNRCRSKRKRPKRSTYRRCYTRRSLRLCGGASYRNSRATVCELITGTCVSAAPSVPLMLAHACMMPGLYAWRSDYSRIPAKQDTLPDLAQDDSMLSERPMFVERLFTVETGMGFAAWRQRLRIVGGYAAVHGWAVGRMTQQTQLVMRA